MDKKNVLPDELIEFLIKSGIIPSVEVDDDINIRTTIEFVDEDEEVPFSDISNDFVYGEVCTKCMEKSCVGCPVLNELDDYDSDPPMWGIPDIDRIVFSGPATIVFWVDGTKTVVKCMPGEKIERYAGFAAACMKKMFGSTSRAKAIMEECAEDQVVIKDKKIKPSNDSEIMFGGEVVATPVDICVQEAIDESFNG